MHSEGNHLIFTGRVTGSPLPVTAALHTIVEKRGYQDVFLDFRSATFLSVDYMLPIVTMCLSYRLRGVDFDLVLPEDPKTAALFRNANWAHFISPDQHAPMDDRNIMHMSARQYNSSQEHFRAVDDSMAVLLMSVPNIDRSRLKALEWALNEVTDNVLNHANSSIGGIMQVVTFPRLKRVVFYVCDAGVTIPRSLRSGRSDISNDTMALRDAIKEGVTRDKKTNQGNGLFGTSRCCVVSGGEFKILSCQVSLQQEAGKISVIREKIPFSGTYVSASIAYNYERLLEEALVFGGRSHDPGGDYIGRVYHSDGDVISFVVNVELTAYGSRDAGRMARIKIENLMDNGRLAIEFDFIGIKVISSSFADEVFGMLFEDLGEARYRQLCRFKNLDATVRGLIERAVEQRRNS